MTNGFVPLHAMMDGDGDLPPHAEFMLAVEAVFTAACTALADAGVRAAKQHQAA